MHKFYLNLGLLSIAAVLMILFPKTTNAQMVVYTTFGPSHAFQTNSYYGICNTTGFQPSDPLCIKSVAAPFTPAGTFTLTQIDVAAFACQLNSTTAIPLQVALLSDSSGTPGGVLESWTVTNCSGLASYVSVIDTLNLELSSGTQYWVEVSQLGASLNSPSTHPDTGGWNLGPSLSGSVAKQDLATSSNWTASTAVLPAFDILGDPTGLTRFRYVGFSFNQGIRLTVVAGPTNVPPGVPVEAVLGFLDTNGNSIGPSRTVTLTPGETESLDLNFNAMARPPGSGQRVEVLPVVTPPPGTTAFSAPIRASAEVSDNLIGFGTVFQAGSNSLPSAPTFTPQGLAGGQTMRITVFSFPPNPCAAVLSFADSKGNPTGSTLPVNVTGGQSASLDLNADTLSLRLGQKIEIQPIVTLAPVVGAAAPQTSACPASVEVFDHFTNRTETYQGGSAQ